MSMRPVDDLKRLSEKWWEKLASSTAEDQSVYAESFLRWFGWEDPAPVACPGDLQRVSALSYLLHEGPQGVVAAHFVLPAALKAPAHVLERGLDFCDTTRVLVNATHAMKVRYAFITDLFRAYLYDTANEELLLTADTPAEIGAEFADALGHASVQEGALAELRRNPRSHVARQLREWRQRWCDTLIVDWQCPEESAWLALDRLVMLRYMADRNVLRTAGWEIRRQFVELLARATATEPKGVGRGLVRLYRTLWETWNADLYKPQPQLEALLEQEGVAVPLLRELRLLSRSRFQLYTILESFNYGEAPEKARVRMIPEKDEERDAYLAKRTIENVDETRVELDLEADGYRAICHWYDELVRVYFRLGREYEETMAQSAPPEAQDLFEWCENDASQPRAFSDPFHHAVENGLVLYYATPRQRRTARLMLYMHLIERHRAARMRLLRFPELDAALQPRPRMLDSDRKRLYEPSQENSWEAM